MLYKPNVPACRVVTYWLYSQSCAGECIDDINTIHAHPVRIRIYARVLHYPADRITPFCETPREAADLIASQCIVNDHWNRHYRFIEDPFFLKQCTVSQRVTGCNSFDWIVKLFGVLENEKYDFIRICIKLHRMIFVCHIVTLSHIIIAKNWKCDINLMILKKMLIRITFLTYWNIIQKQYLPKMFLKPTRFCFLKKR